MDVNAKIPRRHLGEVLHAETRVFRQRPAQRGHDLQRHLQMVVPVPDTFAVPRA